MFKTIIQSNCYISIALVPFQNSSTIVRSSVGAAPPVFHVRLCDHNIVSCLHCLCPSSRSCTYILSSRGIIVLVVRWGSIFYLLDRRNLIDMCWVVGVAVNGALYCKLVVGQRQRRRNEKAQVLGRSNDSFFSDIWPRVAALDGHPNWNDPGAV